MYESMKSWLTEKLLSQTALKIIMKEQKNHLDNYVIIFPSYAQTQRLLRYTKLMSGLRSRIARKSLNNLVIEIEKNIILLCLPLNGPAL